MDQIVDQALATELSVNDIVKLGAVDTEFWVQTFLKKTFRMPSPPMGRAVWKSLNNPAYRYVNLQMFRGSAKTTRLRAFTLKRICYRVSRTVLFIGGSEDSAVRSIQWLRGQIERNTALTQVYGLKPGKKWHETEIEIVSSIDGTSTWIKGAGLTANIRGINFDDYRPDLIICDDVLTDESVISQDARTKTADLLLGAVAGSLISRMEEPNAKLAMLQTPLHKEDASMVASESPMWHTERYGCWTSETEDYPIELQESSWPDMFPTEDLRKQKAAMIAEGKSHIFSREYEVRVTSPESAAMRPTLLRYYEGNLTKRGVSALAIDPTPPPSDATVQKGLHNRDFESLAVVTRAGDYYLRHYELNRGHTPEWTIAKTFELAALYQVSYICVETVAYQSTLKWLLEKEMSRRGIYYSILPVKRGGRKSKFHHIVDTISPLLPLGKLFCRKEHTEFISQLSNYPNVKNDDLLDAVAIALQALINPHVELSPEEYSINEDEYEALPYLSKAP